MKAGDIWEREREREREREKEREKRFKRFRRGKGSIQIERVKKEKETWQKLREGNERVRGWKSKLIESEKEVKKKTPNRQ